MRTAWRFTKAWALALAGLVAAVLHCDDATEYLIRASEEAYR